MTFPVRIIPQPETIRDGECDGRYMTAREIRLDAECAEAPEPSVIYADIDTRTGKFTAVTIISRSE